MFNNSWNSAVQLQPCQQQHSATAAAVQQQRRPLQHNQLQLQLQFQRQFQCLLAALSRPELQPTLHRYQWQPQRSRTMVSAFC